MLCDVWTLARNARKLAFHPWARGRTAVVGSLCDAPIGSSTSSPATSQHGSSLDGSLPSMLLAFCTASPGSLRRPAGPARTASGAMALLSTYLFDACRLSNLVAGGRPAWRAARWQPAQYALDSDFCLAALTEHLEFFTSRFHFYSAWPLLGHHKGEGPSVDQRLCARPSCSAPASRQVLSSTE